MKTTVNLYDFRDAFQRADRAANFSYDGLRVLFEHLEQLELDTGDEMELDVVALCCEYAEDSPAVIAEQYGIDLSDIEPGASEDDLRKYVRDWLECETPVAGETGEGNIVYFQF